jgi:hypothetical protein
MKKTLILVGAFVGVGILGFLFGFVSQSGKITAASNETAACRTESATQAESAARTTGLLELYRARAELGRSNFGSAGDAMVRAKASLTGEPYADVRKAIDETNAHVLKQEAASADEIGAIIKSVEGTSSAAVPKAP